MKVGSIVEEATRISRRSSKSMDEECKEAEKKVVLDFPKKKSLYFLIQKVVSLNMSSGGEACQVCEGGEGGDASLMVDQQEQEVNLQFFIVRLIHPPSVLSESIESPNI